MHSFTRLPTVIAGLAALVLVAGLAGSADAGAARQWQTLVGLNKAKGQVCVAGEPGYYRNVQLRHFAKKAKGKSKSIYFNRDGNNPWERLGATPWVSGGSVYDHNTAYAYEDRTRTQFKIKVKFKGGPSRARTIMVRQIQRCGD